MYFITARCCSLFVLPALILAFAIPTCARAEDSLAEGLDKLAAAIAGLLREENLGNAIVVGDFAAPPRLEASGGRGLSEAIIAALIKHKIEVKKTAPVQLLGRFSLRDEKESSDAKFESVALRLRAELLDKNDEVLKAFNVSVFGPAAAQVTGATYEPPPKASEEERQKEFRERVEKPQAAVVGTQTRALATSPYGIEVAVANKPRTPQLDGGRSFVSLGKGEEYVVRLFNHSTTEAAATLTIDGLSMFKYSKEGEYGNQVLVPPGSYVEIPGWYLTREKSAAFVITSYPESAAGLNRVPSAKVGTITAAFAASWDPAQKPPADEVGTRSADSATGIGREIDKKYVQVNRVIGRPRAVVSVRYNR